MSTEAEMKQRGRSVYEGIDGANTTTLAPGLDVIVSAIPQETLHQSGLVRRPTVVGELPKIRDYELLGEIGSGGMGAVFLARHALDPREACVALKTIRPDLAGTGIARRFDREIQAIRNLRHPFIVEILDLSHPSEWPPCIVMPYFVRGSLAHLVKREGQLPIRDVIRFAWQTASALAHANELGIRHGDIKPANLLVSDDGESVFVTDFGLARNFTSNIDADGVHERVCIGTPPYMSPQMVDGKEEGYSADIYMFGATLYELLAGRPPYMSDAQTHEECWGDILRQVREGPPSALGALRPDAPKFLVDVVEKAMARDVEKRYAQMRTIADDLSRGRAQGTWGAVWSAVWRALSRVAGGQEARDSGGVGAFCVWVFGPGGSIPRDWQRSVMDRASPIRMASPPRLRFSTRGRGNSCQTPSGWPGRHGRWAISFHSSMRVNAWSTSCRLIPSLAAMRSRLKKDAPWRSEARASRTMTDVPSGPRRASQSSWSRRSSSQPNRPVG